MRKRVLFASFVMFGAGCSGNDANEAADRISLETNQAQTAVADSLLDPESARFRRVKRVSAMPARAQQGTNSMMSDSTVPYVAGRPALPEGYCGEVNAKNRMGGYVGFRRFVYFPSRQLAIVQRYDGGMIDLPDALTGGNRALSLVPYDEYCDRS